MSDERGVPTQLGYLGLGVRDLDAWSTTGRAQGATAVHIAPLNATFSCPHPSLG